MKHAFKKWKHIAKKIAGVQANIVLTIMYVLFIIPARFLMRDKKVPPSRNTYWIKRSRQDSSLQAARTQ